MGAGGLATAKAGHDNELEERRKPSELSLEDLAKEASGKKCPAAREAYAGPVSVVGKDAPCEVGMRVRMGEGLLSHGEGTVVEIGAGEEEDGTCSVIWDSDQCSTRAMHAKLGTSSPMPQQNLPCRCRQPVAALGPHAGRQARAEINYPHFCRAHRSCSVQKMRVPRASASPRG